MESKANLKAEGTLSSGTKRRMEEMPPLVTVRGGMRIPLTLMFRACGLLLRAPSFTTKETLRVPAEGDELGLK